jgi:hypothetical protein
VAFSFPQKFLDFAFLRRVFWERASEERKKRKEKRANITNTFE